MPLAVRSVLELPRIVEGVNSGYRQRSVCGEHLCGKLGLGFLFIGAGADESLASGTPRAVLLGDRLA